MRPTEAVRRVLRVALTIAATLAACSDASEPRASARAAVGTTQADRAARPVTGLAASGDVSFASFSHTCALVDGGLQCWGANGFGQLGDRSPAARAPLPVRVSGLPEPVVAVASGGAHTCALADGAVWCWGNNTAGQLGSDRGALQVAPGRVAGLPAPVTALAAGRKHTCAIADGEVWCWGRSEAGELGSVPDELCRGLYGSQPCTAVPARVRGLGRDASALALGDAHSCALLAGEVRCWGRADRGQLGAKGGGASPAAAVSLPGPAASLAAGGDHTCAVVERQVWCWGANDRGQLGDGSRTDRFDPVLVPGLEADALATGRSHTCATTDGRARCWGSNAEGQLGTRRGEGKVVTSPVAPPGLPGDVTALAAGADHTCAAIGAARVECWGDNDYGQLGRGDAPRDHTGPVAVGAWDTGRIRDVARDGRIAVACLGDSNTHGAPGRPRSWCERLQDRLIGASPSWVTINRGQGGASAIGGSLRPARQQLTYTLENDAPDVVILAYGTNDLLAGAQPQEVLVALMQHRQRARSTGAAVFIALTPPAWPASREVNGPIRELNELLRTTLLESRVIDFHTGFEPGDFDDGVHLNDAGHDRRAQVAAAVLRAAGAAEGP